jgi:hypothetical protein
MRHGIAIGQMLAARIPFGIRRATVSSNPSFRMKLRHRLAVGAALVAAAVASVAGAANASAVHGAVVTYGAYGRGILDVTCDAAAHQASFRLDMIGSYPAVSGAGSGTSQSIAAAVHVWHRVNGTWQYEGSSPGQRCRVSRSSSSKLARNCPTGAISNASCAPFSRISTNGSAEMNALTSSGSVSAE